MPKIGDIVNHVRFGDGRVMEVRDDLYRFDVANPLVMVTVCFWRNGLIMRPADELTIVTTKEAVG